MTKKTQPLPHCESCGLQIVSTMYPLREVDGQMICSRHKEYPVKQTMYVCKEKCRGNIYDDKDVPASDEIGAGSQGVIVGQTAKVVKLKLMNGAVVSVVKGLFEKKWGKE